jgi:hypothetical protein
MLVLTKKMASLAHTYTHRSIGIVKQASQRIWQKTSIGQWVVLFSFGTKDATYFLSNFIVNYW